MAKRRSDDNERVDDGYDDLGDDDADLDAADQRRFASNVGYCPECGAEVVDDADICPKCFTWIDGTTHSRPSKLKRSLHTIVVVLLIVAAIVGFFGIALVTR